MRIVKDGEWPEDQDLDHPRVLLCDEHDGKIPFGALLCNGTVVCIDCAREAIDMIGGAMYPTVEPTSTQGDV